MRTAAAGSPPGFAVVALAVAALLGYGVASKYGAAPNGGGIGEAIAAVIGLALPTALVVLGLAYVGTGGLAPPRRRRVVVVAAALTVLVCALAVPLGSLALDQRRALRGILRRMKGR